MSTAPGSAPQTNFVQDLVAEHNAASRWGAWPDGRPKVVTRFPPEPNGYLHIGHAKSIWLNYGLALDNGGRFNLRFDDTNPAAEEEEYVQSIIRDVRWLGARWEGVRDDDVKAGVFFASDYFQQMYDWAIELVKKGKAYVCDLAGDQVSEYRGSLTRPGKPSPTRDRSVAENLDLLDRMRRGEFPDGSRTLRAKVDVAHPNLNMRDPILYRILHEAHHRTGKEWCIYPMYDWAHGFEDSIEGITHSICTLEFENHRPLYDWFIDAVNEGRTEDGSGPWGRRIHHPLQIEFARLAITHTVMSKRKLLELVRSGLVRGWDDPRMPTLSGLRRRGYTPEAIRAFCLDVGVARFNSVIQIVRLENALREQLNRTAPRRMAVLRPLKLVIDNWPDVAQPPPAVIGVAQPPSAVAPVAQPPSAVIGVAQPPSAVGGPGRIDLLDAVNNPEDASAGTRQVPFSRELYIEQDDFRETPPKGFFRLSPGTEVRLRYAYFVKCTGFTKDDAGNVIEVHCTYDPATRGGDAPDGRKVKATLHWVSAAHAVPAEVRLYDHLFHVESPDDVPEGVDWKTNLNPASLEELHDCKLEPSLASAKASADAIGNLTPDRFQFERLGYFSVDPDSKPGALVFNRAVSLKDTWARVEKKK